MSNRRNNVAALPPLSESRSPRAPTITPPEDAGLFSPLTRRQSPIHLNVTYPWNKYGNVDTKYPFAQYILCFWDTIWTILHPLFLSIKTHTPPNMTGKNVIITGMGSDGLLGMEMAKSMAEAGATTWLVCRNREEAGACEEELVNYLFSKDQTQQAQKAQKDLSLAREALNEQRRDSSAIVASPSRRTDPRVKTLIMDMRDPESIRTCCAHKARGPIDVLILHANAFSHRRWGSSRDL